VERRSGGDPGAQGCTYGGRQFAIGDSFPAGDGCNTCSCTEQGVACTEMGCSTGGVGGVGGGVGGVGGGVATGGTTGAGMCLFEGRWYGVGESFVAADGCNKCGCDADGTVSCSLLPCPPPAGCIYEGRTYALGASFPSSDGCNTCTCYEGGAVGCTTMACVCDPTAEWYRHYVATSPSQCELIDYECPANTTYFGNDCGCGCEQDRSCPQWFDCMEGSACDPVAIKQKCPYSGIAL
jgi:hypothetical protein